MNNKSKKNFISIMIIVFLFVTINITCFAQDPFSGIAIGGLGGASAGGLFGSMAGMSGVNIGYVSDPVNDSIWNNLNPDSVYFSGTKHEADPVQDPEDIYDYITVNLQDWLSAQNDFIDEFVSNYQVTDNDSGSFNSELQFDGIPININISNLYHSGLLDSRTITTKTDGVYMLGNTHIGAKFTVTSGGKYLRIEYYYNGSVIQQSSLLNSPDNQVYSLSLARSTGSPYDVFIEVNKGNSQGSWQRSNKIGNCVTPTTVTYTSTTVDTGVFDNWSEVKVKIPHATSGLNPDWTVQDFVDAINNAWANHQENTIVIEDNSTPPVPPVPPIDTPLGDVPFDDWLDTWGQSVITNQETGNDSLDNIDTNIQTGVDTLDSIDTNIGTTNGILGQIKDLIQSGFNSITNLLNQILTGVQALVNSIVNATETLIAGILNQIPIAFQTAWNTLKQHVSIWHYVVEWVTSITAPFTWIWGIASGTSYYIILPVYASLAGAVVLALYKKFGR